MLNKQKLSARDMMSNLYKILIELELGEYSQYIVGQKTNDYWKTVTFNIMREEQDHNEIKLIEPKQRIQRMLTFKTNSQDISPHSTPNHRLSLNDIPIPFFETSQQVSKPQKKPIKPHYQKWDIIYHQINDEFRTRIATLDARNEKNMEDTQNEGNQQENLIEEIRRKSCECSIDGWSGSKQRRCGDYEIEVWYHKKKRLANTMKENLSQTKRGSFFGKHQSKITMLRWAIKSQANNNPQTPIIARSSSFEDDSPGIGQTPQKLPMKNSIKIQRTKSRFMTIQAPIIQSQKNIVSQNLIEVDENELIFTQQSIHKIQSPKLSIKRLNQAQKNVYYPRISNRDIPKINQNHQKINCTYDQQIDSPIKNESVIMKNQSCLLPSIQKKDILSKSYTKPKPNDFIGVYFRKLSISARLVEHKKQLSTYKPMKRFRLKEKSSFI